MSLMWWGIGFGMGLHHVVWKIARTFPLLLPYEALCLVFLGTVSVYYTLQRRPHLIG